MVKNSIRLAHPEVGLPNCLCTKLAPEQLHIIAVMDIESKTYRSIVGVGGVRKRFNHGPSLSQLVSQCEKDSLNMVRHRIILGTG